MKKELELKGISEEEIFGICTYAIYGGGLIIFMELMKSLKVNTIFLNSKVQNFYGNVKTINYVEFQVLSKKFSVVLSFIVNFIKIFLYISKNIRTHKTVIVNDFGSLIYIAFHLLYKKLRVIFFCHTSFPKSTFNRVILSKFINFYSDTVIVPSQYLKDELILMGVKENKIVCIYNGIDIPHVQNDLNNDEYLNIAIFGLIDKLKGQDIFAEAVSEIKNEGFSIRGYIVGPIGDNDFFTDIKKTYSQSFVDQTIKYEGILNHGEALELMAKMDIIVCLSRYRETLPTVLLEALALKKPVIGTLVGGIPEIITNNVNGFLISPGNSSELKNSIIQLYKNKDLRCDFGNSGLRIFNEKFLKDNFVAKHRQIVFNVN